MSKHKKKVGVLLNKEHIDVTIEELNKAKKAYKEFADVVIGKITGYLKSDYPDVSVIEKGVLVKSYPSVAISFSVGWASMRLNGNNQALPMAHIEVTVFGLRKNGKEKETKEISNSIATFLSINGFLRTYQNSLDARSTELSCVLVSRYECVVSDDVAMGISRAQTVVQRKSAEASQKNQPKEKKKPTPKNQSSQQKQKKQSKKSYVKYYEYIESEAWQQKRRQRMAMDKYNCQMCGTAKNLVVHHLTYDNLGNEPMSDLITLCKKCHEKVHRQDLKK